MKINKIYKIRKFILRVCFLVILESFMEFNKYGCLNIIWIMIIVID